MPGNIGEVGYVPLFVKRPSQQEGEIVDRPVQLIDVFPTILDVLGAEPPEGVEGRSAFDTDGEPPERILKSPGHAHEMSADAVELWDAVERKHELFGGVGGWERLFRMPPHEDLVGRDLDDLPVAAPASDVTLRADADQYTNVDPDGAFVPNLLTGQLLAEEEFHDPEELVVAVNGRVEATAETFDDEQRNGAVSVALPPGIFHRGENTVTVLLIDGDGTSRVLRPVGFSD